MEFKQRTSALSLLELDELVKVSPSERALREGFKLQDPEVNELLQAANEIASSLVTVKEDDAGGAALGVLQKTVVVLQLALDVATKDNEALTSDFNNVQQDLQDLEQDYANLQEENELLRERQDLQAPSGARADISSWQEDLQSKLAERDDRIEALLEQQEKDAAKLKQLEQRLQEADNELKLNMADMDKLKLELQTMQLQTRELETQLTSQARMVNRRELQDNIKQHEWKIERLTKDNRALAAANVELRNDLQELKEENLQVSERIVMLDEENRGCKLQAADLEGKLEAKAAENSQLLEKQMDLYTEVQEKLNLLEAFEDKFDRQYRSWEEEREGLQQHIARLKKESRSFTSKGSHQLDGLASASGTLSDGGSVQVELEELHSQLEEARDKELLLLEAYEQLEKDVAKEVDRALSQQRDEFERLRKRTEFLEQHLHNERGDVHQLREQHGVLELELQEAVQRNGDYEQGIYGLPQATLEIKQLKQSLREQSTHCQELSKQMTVLTTKIEDLHDENTVLRKQVGLTTEERVDITQIKQQREALVMQLRSVNAMLECQVADLEEERRKLRMELKFRAKYHGQHALEMGLTPEQLLLVEQYVEEMKYGRSPDGDLVSQLQKRIEFLEVRLAEVMAFADIPPSIRPLLEKASGMSLLQAASSPAAAARAAHAAAAAKALLEALAALKQVQSRLGQEPGSNAREVIQQVVQQLTEAERLVESLQSVSEEAAHSNPHQGQSSEALAKQVAGQDGQSELGKQVVELAKTVLELQKELAQKDVQLQQIPPAGREDSRASLNKAPALAAATTPSVEEASDAAVLKALLVKNMEQLVIRENELDATRSACSKYQAKMQSIVDQVKLLYRDYANSSSRWKAERDALQQKLKRVQEDADGFKASNQELERGMQVVASQTPGTVQAEFMDVVRKMAVVQIKHARVARRLEASAITEKTLQDRVVELEHELSDVSSSCRSRVVWLESALAESSRRNEQLLQELQCCAPLEAYHELLKKYTELVGQQRLLTEAKAQSLCTNIDQDQLVQDVADLTSYYLTSAAECKKLQAQVEQLQALAAGVSPADLQGLQNTKLVAATVELETATKQAELAQREMQRVQQTLSESQERTKELEAHLSRLSAELSGARAEVTELTKAKEGGKSAAEVKVLMDRLHAAEHSAVAKEGEAAQAKAHAEDAKRQVQEAQQKAKVQLAQACSLRAAMRDMMAGSDQAASFGKLQLQLENSREKEALMRGSLNRSELERLELEKQIRDLREQLLKSQGKGSLLQEQVKWAQEQRKKAQAQLQIELAERVEGWKARRWALKLEKMQEQQSQQFKGLKEARSRVLELDVDLTQLRLQQEDWHEQQSMLAKPVSQVHTQALQLREQLLQHKIEASAHERQAFVFREQVAYLERVVAELQSMLSRYEQDELKERHSLDQQRQEAAAQVQSLQEQVATLHTRLSTVAAEADARVLAARAAARNAIAAAGGASVLQGQIPASAKVTDSLVVDVARDAPRIKAAMQNMAAADREVMLSQIETLKKAREEAEHLRQEANVLRNDAIKKQQELERLQAMYDDVLQRLTHHTEAQLAHYDNALPARDAGQDVINDLKAIAEATVQELHTKIRERDTHVSELEQKLDLQREEHASEQMQLRSELQQLKKQLLLANNKQIVDARRAMDETSRMALRGPGKDDVSYEELRNLCDEQTAKLEQISAVVRQKESRLLVMQKEIELQAKRFEQEIMHVKEEAHKARNDTSHPKFLVQKLKGQLNSKDEKLRQLKEAIKQLEQKLVEKMKEAADVEINKASWHDQEDLDERVRELEKERRALVGKLEAARKETADLKELVKELEAEIKRVNQDLQRECSSTARLREDLSRERSALQKLRTAQEQVVDMSNGMSLDWQKKLEKAQNRIHVLEQQNATLKQKLDAEKVAVPAASSSAVDEASSVRRIPVNRSKSNLTKSMEPLSRLRQADAAIDSDGSASEASTPADSRPATSPAPTPAVKAWEEHKRLSLQLERANKKLAKKEVGFAELQKAVATRDATIASLQRKVDEQAAALKSFQKQPRLTEDIQVLRQYAVMVVDLEEKLSNAEAELAVLQQQHLQQLQKHGPPADSGSAPGMSKVQMFELQLQRDNAQAQVQRLRQHLQVLFGPNAEAAASASPASAQPSSRTKTKARALSVNREAELLNIIESLRNALDKATTSTVPTSKYMAELSKRKELQQQLTEHQKQVDKAKQQVAAVERRCADLQFGNNELRQQLAEVQSETRNGLPAEAANRLASLEHILAQKDVELQSLRNTLRDKEAGGAAAPAAAVEELQARLAALEAENADLHNELSAFDPEFFAEIEDLKYDHHELLKRCASYEQQIAELTRKP